MKHILFFLLLVVTSISVSAQNVNLKKGYAAEGYDVVSYFQDNPQKGAKEFTHTFEDVKYKFASKENLQKFQKNPTQYIPQYGGFCAYAIAKKGEKVSVNPETYLIEDGKLYLFYNSWGVNTLDKWNEEGAQVLQKKADAIWTTLHN